MKIKMLISFVVMSAFLFGSCAEEGYPLFYPGDSDKNRTEDGAGDDTPEPDPDPPFVLTEPDYTALTADNHPRVIFSDDDFLRLKETVAAGSNKALSSIHTGIVSLASSYLDDPDLEYDIPDGKRLLSVSRNAQQRILFCAYAYRMTSDRQYLEQAEHDITTVCSFKDWNARNHFLDVGEMAAGVALGYDWLYDELSAETKTLVRKALNDYAFVPAEEGTWNLDFYKATNNWNQVCNGGLVCAALAVYEDNEDVARSIIEKAIESNLPAMQAMYSPDGNYPEGYSYWNYGTLYEALMLTALETAAGTDTGLSNVPGFADTGKYMVFMEGPSGSCFNYSDCAPGSLPCLAQWYFAWKFKDMSVLYLEQDRVDGYKSSSEARLLPLIAFYAADVVPASISAPTEHIFSGAGVTPVVLVHDTWTMGTDDRFLGIKAGQGNTSHAHLDAGSFVYDADGVRWAADLGLQSYGTLEPYINLWNMNDNSERWTAFRYNNLNHNTITINGEYHRVAGAGTVEKIIDEDGRRGAVVDITAPFGGAVESAERTIYIEGDNLVITDHIVANADEPASVRWTMVTPAVPAIEYGSITLSQGGKYMFLTKEPSAGGRNPSWEIWSTQSDNSWDASNDGYYECGYTVTLEAGEEAEITVTLTPEDPLG